MQEKYCKENKQITVTPPKNIDDREKRKTKLNNNCKAFCVTSTHIRNKRISPSSDLKKLAKKIYKILKLILKYLLKVTEATMETSK